MNGQTFGMQLPESISEPGAETETSQGQENDNDASSQDINHDEEALEAILQDIEAEAEAEALAALQE